MTANSSTATTYPKACNDTFYAQWLSKQRGLWSIASSCLPEVWLEQLVDRMRHGQLSLRSDTERLYHHVTPQEMCNGKLELEVSTADPEFGHHPVFRAVSGSEQGIIWSWLGPHLDGKGNEVSGGAHEQEAQWRHHVSVISILVVGWNVI